MQNTTIKTEGQFVKTHLVRLVQGRFEGGDLAGERRAAKFSDRNNVISEMNSSLVRKVQFLINSPVPGSITPIKGDERQL